MNDYTDRILELLKGHSQFKPLRGDDLVAELRHLDPDTLNDMIDDLQGRGAINRAEITKNGKTYTALWPTGLVPRALSWKDERNNGKGLMGAQLAHNLQQDAERSRNTSKPVPTPVPTPAKEPTMTRIARPAQIVEEVAPAKLVKTPHVSNRPRNTGINGGAVQSAVLAVLEAGGVLDVETIFSRLTVATTKGSVGKILETLGKRGVIEATIQFHNKRHRRFYCMPGTDRAAAPVCSEPLCAELPGNLRTLRKLGADDHTADAGKTIELINPPFTAATTAPAAPAAPAAPIAPQADAPTLPENDGGTHFALFDSGTLLITSGDEFIALPIAESRRLADYLRNVSDALYAGAV